LKTKIPTRERFAAVLVVYQFRQQQKLFKPASTVNKMYPSTGKKRKRRYSFSCEICNRQNRFTHVPCSRPDK